MGLYNQYYILNPTLAQIRPAIPPILMRTEPHLSPPPVPGPDLAWPSHAGEPALYLYDLRCNNLGEALIEGVDFAINYTTDIEGFGNLSAGISAPSTPPTQTRLPPAWPPSISCSTARSASPPLTAFVAAQVGPVTGRVTVNYSPGFNVSPVLNQALSLYNQQRISSFHPVNLYVGYDLSGLAPWLSDSEASITMNNVADDSPPIYLSGGAAKPNNGAPYHRVPQRRAVHRVQPAQAPVRAPRRRGACLRVFPDRARDAPKV